MKFIKFEHQNSTGYKLINVDQIKEVNVNTKSTSCQVVMKDGGKFGLFGQDVHKLVKHLSKLNVLTEHHLSLGIDMEE